MTIGPQEANRLAVAFVAAYGSHSRDHRLIAGSQPNAARSVAEERVFNLLNQHTWDGEATMRKVRDCLKEFSRFDGKMFGGSNGCDCESLSTEAWQTFNQILDEE